VALDLELTVTKRALVITGPNAGGKTVALKTVGLLTLAHLCGLPIPADRNSRLPFLANVVATVGDEQDMLADRSTFSGRLHRLQEAWTAAGPDSLILLDELGSGTDPDEGTALSTALLEGLAERGCLMLVTTHLSQLAAAALETDGAFCAAMQFDSETDRPTYRLFLGPPGGSKALALARRLGLPAALLDRAEALLGSEHRNLRRLLAETERARQELSKSQQRLDVELADAAKLRERLAKQEGDLVDERKALNKTLSRQLEVFREETRRRLREEITQLQATYQGGKGRHLTRAAEGRLFDPAPTFDVEDVSDPGPIRLGGQVEHRRLRWVGKLEKLERGKAKVLVGGKSLHCKATDLVAVEGRSPTKSPLNRGPKASPTARRQGPLRSSAEVPRELKLIGERVEPALDLLDRFLDKALMASLSRVRIIHGHGSGRLRSAVREHLHAHPAVTGQRAGQPREGGDGATIADLGETLP